MFNNTLIKAYCGAEVYIKGSLKQFFKKEDGVTAVEYAIVVAGVAAVVLIIFGSKGPVWDMLNSTFTTLKTSVTGMIGGGTPTP
ncbi:Flp family type IVb pilin [Citrobacter amalonaticus]|uniref:Flp family type IVb pilin n=1 Tax=Citrobacter amalonaticus TaxID=35703 RepID=A0A2S4RY26_CITAM|nr:Flp family type IVb pilin [Citrobacter amalonaticus]POT57846.1 Flp family type IVb pilin [Citrobacter amalonaticus]POT76627.1 Flp family type IVb pilin [Citrobacter amalonaticus]POU65706.1 Flp family type IVb pilin [Citrobacter amalonaticus]POV05863.1 Flp family type IVb pilin [Citrobacter amalonaticus]